jgi:hypothetical protein
LNHCVVTKDVGNLGLVTFLHSRLGFPRKRERKTVLRFFLKIGISSDGVFTSVAGLQHFAGAGVELGSNASFKPQGILYCVWYLYRTLKHRILGIKGSALILDLRFIFL